MDIEAAEKRLTTQLGLRWIAELWVGDGASSLTELAQRPLTRATTKLRSASPVRAHLRGKMMAPEHAFAGELFELFCQGALPLMTRTPFGMFMSKVQPTTCLCTVPLLLPSSFSSSLVATI